jgi:ABC-type glycerol-3-phosphate transport system substrate-binding protein
MAAFARAARRVRSAPAVPAGLVAAGCAGPGDGTSTSTSTSSIPITIRYTLSGGGREAVVDMVVVVAGNDGYAYPASKRFSAQ